MKRLISHVRLLFIIQLVHLFSNTFETARYNMIIHVIDFLVNHKWVLRLSWSCDLDHFIKVLMTYPVQAQHEI